MKHPYLLRRCHVFGAMAMAFTLAGMALVTTPMPASAQMSTPGPDIAALLSGSGAVGMTGLTGTADASGAERIAGAGLPSGQTYLLYGIDLSGVAQGVAFRNQGHLVVTSAIDRTGTRNGVNALDILLITGNPYVPTAPSGTISYATNSGFDELRDGRNAAARLDGAFVGYNGNTRTLDVRPDPGVAAALSLNNFTGRGGLLGDVYLIKNGQMLIQFTSDFRGIAGVADLVGTGYIYHSNTPYRAQLTGRFVQQGQFQ